MLLRSSSTPVIGTLLPFSDSPNRDLDALNKNKPIKNAPLLTFFHGVHHHNQSLKPYSCNYSPIQNSSSGFRESNRESRVSGPKSIRRAQSEGNLKKLLLAHEPIDLIEFRNPETETKPGFPRYRSMLRTEPSLSIFNDEFRDPEVGSGQALQRTVTIGETIEDVNGGGDFSIGKRKMGLIEEEEGEGEPESLDGVQNWGNGEEVIERVGTPPLCIASGLGIGASGFDPSPVDFGESIDMKEYYKKMVDQCPFHPLFLRNYAQFLQSKGDLYGAEEYYSRASLADPEDGEIWMQYANLVWVLYHDQERASSYYKLATEVAPEDSNVLAAYASFLWEIEDDGDGEGAHENHFQVEKREYVNQLNISSPKKEDSSRCLNIAREIDLPDSIAITDGPFQSGNLEDYYRKMIEENPNSPLFLRNYAKFLDESKGDLQGAEEYYARAILADPGDGEIMAQYAKLVWERHRDCQKTLSYFERAVEASPDNSHVLAAYASFLWENEDDEEEDQVKVPLFHGRTVTAANV
ncbi:Signal transduction response regulator [Parasponia andersonii]|uniref:Signal transduction response regulator n=1 Tax=Parasponia andersonii TaxID=3476 RepID=A0A2P5ANN8_PARAD|nr:Signal transduction response regulator [Parasponia andersonii]